MIRTSNVASAFLLLFLVLGCKSDFDDVEVKRFPLNSDQSQVLQSLADMEVAISADWATAVASLRNAVELFKNNPTDIHLKNAQDLWKLARNPWESNESFGFGPVANLNIDPNSDDWPFDVTAFSAILASSVTLDSDFIIQMTTTTKGFHALEFSLFGLSGNKTAADFSQRELLLLDLLAADLKKQADLLNSSWTSGSEGNFYDDFRNAGTANSSSYTTTTAALAEVLGSMVDILTELPDSKIQIPLTLQNDAYLESRFSDYSLSDYRNNVEGTYSVYIGQYGAQSAQNSMSNLVAAANPAINDKVLTQFKLCLALMDLIPPATMNQAIHTKQGQLQDIIVEIQKLNKILDQDVREVLELE